MDAKSFLKVYEQRRPDVMALATLASLARHIDPALIRALRLAFAGPDCPMTVATESGLWFSPLVESRGVSGITLQAEYSQVLRERLAQTPQRLKDARSLIDECHADYPDVLRWEEGIVYLALSNQIGQLEGEYYRGIKSLEGGTRPALERWIIDMAKRLPSAATDHPTLIQLNNLAGGLSLQRATGQSESSMALDFSSVPKRQLGVIGINRSFRIGDVDNAKYGINVPNIPPYTLDVIAPPQLVAKQPTITIQPGESVELDAHYGPVRLRSLDGQVYVLEPEVFFPKKTRVFISYSHRDEAWKNRIAQHLGVLAQQGLLDAWDDRRIAAGDDWLPAIETALNDCHIALLLVSAEFLNSDFVLKREVPTLLQRRAKEGVRVIPVFLKPCAWQQIPWLAKLEGRPVDGKALSAMTKSKAELALAHLAKEILHLCSTSVANDAPPNVGTSYGVPLISPARLRHGAAHLFGRDSELNLLDAAWRNPAVRVLSVVAWGGTGKTSLVVEWLNRFADQGWPDCLRVFDWSFYSQGSKEAAATSSDAFLAEALRFFGNAALADGAASAWDKGARLAALVAQQPSLLVLDGLEPLQHPPGPLAGWLKDPGLQALLKTLARHNPGLCLITTRESIVDLEPQRESSAPELALSRLAEAAGVALLQNLGVHGAEKELRQLVQDVDGHALTLNLLGSYLARAHGGDVRRRDLVQLDRADAAVQGGHAFKAMAAYDAWLAQAGIAGQRQRALLGLLGLFDRPADWSCLQALRQPPVIPGLTDALQDLDETDWFLVVGELRACGLLLESENALDAHPLLREYYARRLQTEQPEAWRAAHQRLFRHLCDTTQESSQPTLSELQPLYQAVAHGARAGLYEEARAKVYRDRILRGTGHDGFYSWRKLGAFASDLAAVACLFDTPWRRPAAQLSAGDQAWLLNQAAIYLRALGRLREALEPMQAGLERRVEQENWKEAAINAGNLSELHGVLGDLPQARTAASRAVDYAERSGEWDMRMVNRTALADALQQMGELEAAAQHFQQAEALQAENQPDYPLLYSVQGFQYCDLLLAAAERAAWRLMGMATQADGTSAIARDAPGDEAAAAQPRWDGQEIAARIKECRAVRGRAEQTLQWVTTQNWLLDIALDHLTLARAELYAGLLAADANALARAETHAQAAVDGLRQAGAQEFITRGLLTRAWLRAVQGRSMEAQMDLAEVQEIAERGPMPLFLADVHLHRARLFGDKTELARAADLIHRHGYRRRLPELQDTLTHF